MSVGSCHVMQFLGQWEAVVSAEGDMCLLSEGERMRGRWSVLQVVGGGGTMVRPGRGWGWYGHHHLTTSCCADLTRHYELLSLTSPFFCELINHREHVCRKIRGVSCFNLLCWNFLKSVSPQYFDRYGSFQIKLFFVNPSWLITTLASSSTGLTWWTSLTLMGSPWSWTPPGCVFARTGGSRPFSFAEYALCGPRLGTAPVGFGDSDGFPTGPARHGSAMYVLSAWLTVGSWWSRTGVCATS